MLSLCLSDTHTHQFMRIHAHTHTHTHTHAQRCTHIHTHTHAHTNLHTPPLHTHTHTHTNILTLTLTLTIHDYTQDHIHTILSVSAEFPCLYSLHYLFTYTFYLYIRLCFWLFFYLFLPPSLPPSPSRSRPPVVFMTGRRRRRLPQTAITASVRASRVDHCSCANHGIRLENCCKYRLHQTVTKQLDEQYRPTRT